MQAFVPKHRKPRFDLTLNIIDLNNIPLVCGTCYVKWHLPSSTTAEHRGRTDKALIRDHKATWEYAKTLSVRLTADKNQTLQDFEIHFEVLQEFIEGGRGGRVILGNIKLNLAEYANRQDEQAADRGPEGEGEDGGITRRYLMQESKINSTLKIGILMKQTEGDGNFVAPPLKTPMVFGGIAGVIGTEGGEGDDLGHMPSITSKTRELSELQDMYRRTLAATWACQAGELPPDKLIEDLFAGGDGGAMKPFPVRSATMANPDHRYDDAASFASTSDGDSKQTLAPRFVSPKLEQNGGDEENGHKRHGHRHGNGGGDGKSSSSASGPAVSGRASIEQQMQQSRKEHKARSQRSVKEMSEFEIRDDLRSWMIVAK